MIKCYRIINGRAYGSKQDIEEIELNLESVILTMTFRWLRDKQNESDFMRDIFNTSGNVFSFVSGGDSTLICFVPHKDVKTVYDNFDTFVNLPGDGEMLYKSSRVLYKTTTFITFDNGLSYKYNYKEV